MAGDNSKGSGRGGGGPLSSSSSKKRPHPPPPASTSSSDHRKSRWESSSKPSAKTSTPNKPTPNRKPIPSPTQPQSQPGPNKPQPQSLPHPFPEPIPPMGPPPPPTYSFHMLDRRTIVLADGSVRSYFALPPDYQDFAPPPPQRFPHLPPLGPMSPDGFCGGPEFSAKRKFGYEEERERERDEYARRKQQLLHYGNAGAGAGGSSPFAREDEYRPSSKQMRFDGGGSGGGGMRQEVKVDPAVMKAFLHFSKVINENADQRIKFLRNGERGPLPCLVCGRSLKDFPDVHSLIMHTYNSDKADSRVDHLGLHRALCVLMGWNYLRSPDNSWAYQYLPADEAAANQDDLIMWPPMVIIHNTNTGKGKDGRMEGLGNKAMDNKIRDLGFSGGKSKSLYSRDGHQGITLVKFASDQSGLKEALRLADHFAKECHGRRDWARVQSMGSGRDDENNPNLVMVDQRTGERRRILYGYLLTVSDLEKVDFETRKKVVIESKNEKLQPSKKIKFGG